MSGLLLQSGGPVFFCGTDKIYHAAIAWEQLRPPLPGCTQVQKKPLQNSLFCSGPQGEITYCSNLEQTTFIASSMHLSSPLLHSAK